MLYFVYTPNPFLLICLIALIELIAYILTVSETTLTLNSLLKENCYSIVTYLRTLHDGSL